MKLQSVLVDPSGIEAFTAPWRELLGGAPHPLLPPPRVRFDWGGRLGVAAAAAPYSRRLFGELRRQHGGGRSDLIEKLEEAFNGRGGVVITGQQPGLLGGPLYALYKAVSAAALAAVLERRLGVPVVPVFWNAGDDDDFQEVRTCRLALPDCRIIGVEVPVEGIDAGRCIGDIPAGVVREVLGRVDWVFDRWGTAGEETRRLLQQAAAANRWGGHVTILLERLLQGGILVFDATSPVWREEGAALALRFVSDEGTIREALDERAGLMRGAGVEPPVAAGSLGVPLTVVEDGIKRKYPRFDAGELRRTASREPGTLCPNVTLRSVYQDTLFPVLATVVGPGEIGYLTQLEPVYRILGIPEPIRVPRLTATLLFHQHRRLAEALGAPWERLVTDLEKSREEFLRSHLPDGFEEEIERLAGSFERDGSRIAARIGGGGKLLREVERIGGRIRALNRFGRERVLRELKGRGMDPVLLSEFLRPRGRLQERSLSALLPLLAGGRRCVEGLVELAADHYRRLEEGDAGHYVIGVTFDEGLWESGGEGMQRGMYH